MKKNPNQVKQQAATIKKLIHQREAARLALESERSSPQLGQLEAELQSLRDTLEVRMDTHEDDLLTRQSHAATVKAHVNDLKTELAATVKLLSDCDAELKELRGIRDRLVTEAVEALKRHLAEVEALRAAAKLDDVAALKKRLAARSEELRLTSEQCANHKAASQKFAALLDQANRELALIPEPIRRDARRSP